MNVGVVDNEDLLIVMYMQRLYKMGILYRDLAFKVVNLLLSILVHKFVL